MSPQSMNPGPIGDRRQLDRLPGGGFVYALIDEAIRIEARYLRSDHGQVYGEINVLADWAGAAKHNGSLACAYQNFSSLAARKALAKYCADRSRTGRDGFDWQGAVESACIEIVRAARAGETHGLVLDDAAEASARDIDVLGLLIPADATSLLVAQGDSLKSLVLLVVLGNLARRGQAVLLLDWEWTADRHKARKRRLFGDDRLPALHYWHCQGPLVTEADRIRSYCDEHGISFLGVDSVGLACDGPLKDDDTAVRFHRALASLRPALAVAHVPKSAIGPDAKDTVTAFGSVYFTNLARMAWAVKKQPGASDDQVTVGLFPTKQNDGARVQPVGLAFTFTPDRIRVTPADLASVEGLAERMPVPVRIAAALKHGPTTIARLADDLGAKADTIEKALRRGEGKRFARVLDSPDGITRWALVERRPA